MSLVDDRAVVSWRFAERYGSLGPSDATGNLADLAEGSTNARPTLADDALTGYGRSFAAASSQGFEVTDAGDDLQLTREVSIVALLELDIDDQDSYGSDGTVVQGSDRSGGRECPFGLRLSVVDAATRQVALKMFWDDEAGIEIEDSGASFTWPEGGGFLLVAAVREIIDGTFTVRYHVNRESFVSGTTYDLDVGSGAGGSALVTVGVGDDAGYQNFFDGTIDMLEILDEPLCPEELEWIWFRFAVDMPDGIKTARRMVPPGAYSDDPDSYIQKELAIEGAALGMAKNIARRIRDYWLPDRAWGDFLERWEALTKYSPKPGDDLQKRRDRVLAFLGTIRGFAIDDVKAELEDSFGLDSADIEIVEYGNDIEHDFTGTEPGDHLSEDGAGAWSYNSSGSGFFQFDATSQDIRFRGSRIEGAGAGWRLWSVADELNAWLAARFVFSTGLSHPEAFVGFMVGSRTLDEWLLFGFNDESSGTVRYRMPDGSWTTLATGVGASLYARIKCTGSGGFELRHGSSAAAADAATPTVVAGGPSQVDWAGVVCTTDDADDSVSIRAQLVDLLIHTPNGKQRFNWYAYRNPGLGGSYDLEGARGVVRRVKPAHTNADAITVKSTRCDDADTGCDWTPLGV